jgi:hypothetical protein
MSPLAASGKVRLAARDQARVGMDAPAKGAKSIQQEVTVQSRETGDWREGHGGVLRSHSTEEGGEPGKDETHWREGVNKQT